LRRMYEQASVEAGFGQGSLPVTRSPPFELQALGTTTEAIFRAEVYSALNWMITNETKAPIAKRINVPLVITFRV